MKTISCDFCDHEQERTEATRPEGWAHIRVDFRWRGNTGANVYQLDVCPECAKKTEYLKAKDVARDLVKASFLTKKIDPPGPVQPIIVDRNGT